MKGETLSGFALLLRIPSRHHFFLCALYDKAFRFLVFLFFSLLSFPAWSDLPLG